MFFHGYRRFTEDVDILVTAEGLEEIHRELEGKGYLPLFAGVSSCATPIPAFASNSLSPVSIRATASQSPFNSLTLPGP
jgi:hypothetical protein